MTYEKNGKNGNLEDFQMSMSQNQCISHENAMNDIGNLITLIHIPICYVPNMIL